MGRMLKKSNKVRKKYNVGVNDKYSSLLKNIYKKKFILLRD